MLGENYWATEKNINIYQYEGMVCYYGKYSDLAQFFILKGGIVQALGPKPWVHSISFDIDRAAKNP